MAQAAAVALPLIGGAFSAAGQIRAGNEAKRAGEAQAAIQEQNAILAESQAESKADAIAQEGERVRGAQKTGYAFSGVDINQGSPLLMEADTISKTALDEVRTIAAGKYEAAGLRYSAAESRRAGQIAQIESRYAAAGSLIGAVGGAAKGYAGSGGGW